MLNQICQNTTYRFLITFIGLFALLHYFNVGFIGLVAPGNYYSPFLAQYLNYIEGIRSFLLNSTTFILELLGYEVYTSGIWLRVVGKGGFLMAYDCLGFGVMSFFTSFVIAYPKLFKTKWWFLIAGMILIQSLNILRFILLGIYWKNSDLKQVIDHHDIFNIILYIILLIVIYSWINYNGDLKQDTNKIKKEDSLASANIDETNPA